MTKGFRYWFYWTMMPTNGLCAVVSAVGNHWWTSLYCASMMVIMLLYPHWWLGVGKDEE